ncbi:hypothetical protein FGB62_41g26 [Gracilaria domingensis]|nr:hypothetical protein FGB62_41g26 [Gracilaria domingensis]
MNSSKDLPTSLSSSCSSRLSSSDDSREGRRAPVPHRQRQDGGREFIVGSFGRQLVQASLNAQSPDAGVGRERRRDAVTVAVAAVSATAGRHALRVHGVFVAAPVRRALRAATRAAAPARSGARARRAAPAVVPVSQGVH